MQAIGELIDMTIADLIVRSNEKSRQAAYEVYRAKKERELLDDLAVSDRRITIES